jgi:hypothetical protein
MGICIHNDQVDFILAKLIYDQYDSICDFALAKHLAYFELDFKILVDISTLKSMM